MKDMSPDLRRLLDDARSADDPTAADRDRVRAALVAGLAAGAGSTATAGGGKLGLMGRLGIVALVGALLAGGVWWFASSTSDSDRSAPANGSRLAEPAAPPPPAAVREGVKGWSDQAAEPPAAERPAAPADAAPPAPTDAAPQIVSSRAVRSKPKVRDAAQLAEEARLLREAETARRGGDVGLATQRLDEHRRRFPRGALATEREAARILVLCDAGRTADAKKLAARFLRRYPRSPLADRVRSACDRSIP